jgi:hypothetical protein
MKTTTEITLKPDDSDFIVSLDFENANEPRSINIEVASVGDMLVEFNPQAAHRKQEALETAALIETVSDTEQQKLAIETVGTLKAYTNSVEKSRKEVKQPFWDAGCAIDALAKKESKPVLEEIKRVEGLLATYQRAQDAKEKAIREEQERIERERIAEENRRISEENRLREEAARLAASKGKKAQAAAALARAQADTIAAERRADEAAARFSPGTLVDTFTKPAGTINRKDWDIEVTSWADFHAVFGWRYIRCELDLQAFKYYLSTAGEGLDITKIPGVKITPKTSVHVKATKN